MIAISFVFGFAEMEVIVLNAKIELRLVPSSLIENMSAFSG